MIFMFALIGIGKAKASSDQCSAASLSKDCAIFDSLPSRIELPDGTFFSNPRKPPPVKVDADKTRQAKIQDELEGLFDTIKIPKMSRRFRRALLDPSLLSTLSSANDQTKLKLPWPPGHAEGPVRDLTYKSFKDQFWNKLNSKQRSKFEELITRMGNLDTQRIESKVVGKKRKDEVRALFKNAQESIKQSILRGRDPSQLKESELAAIKKVETVVFVDLDHDQYDNQFSCSINSDNAHYDPQDHSIFICPGGYTSPTASLIYTLGHEIAHAIDPCCSQFDLYEVDHNKLSAETGKSKGRDPVKQWAYEAMKSEADGPYFTSAFKRRLKDPNLMNEFVDKGILKPVAKGIGPEHYFAQGPRDCFKTNEGMRSEPAPAEVEVRGARNPGARGGASSSSGGPGKVKNQYPHCDMLTSEGSSSMGEVMSDYFGAMALADYVKKNPPKTDVEKLGIIGSYYEEICLTPSQKREDFLQSGSDDVSKFQQGSYEEQVAYLAASRKSMASVHPPTGQRVDQILLKHPQVREALGCGPHPQGSCFDPARWPSSDGRPAGEKTETTR